MRSGASEQGRMRLLFVCTGNICRSPLAEAIFAHLAREAGGAERYAVDSAGLEGWHAGDPADARSCRVGARHGVDVPSIAREFQQRDFERFDLILAMDRGHLRALRARAPEALRHKVRLMRDYDRPSQRGGDVPDPYYGGASEFEEVFQMLMVCCRNLLDTLEAARSEPNQP